MSNAFIKMGCVDLATFIRGVFSDSFCLAKNSLVPITIGPEYYFLSDEPQTLQATFEACNSLCGPFWPSVLGPTSLGQFSARQQTDIFVLARSDIVFRRPTEEEVAQDFECFGEQVMGSEFMDEEKLGETETTLDFCNQRYRYAGPPRFKRATLTARIVNRFGLPSLYEFLAMKNEIDTDHGDPKNSIFQTYFVFVAESVPDKSAKLKILGFEENGKFDPGKFQSMGTVQAMEDKEQLWFYPEGNISKKIDFSKNFWRG